MVTSGLFFGLFRLCYKRCLRACWELKHHFNNVRLRSWNLALRDSWKETVKNGAISSFESLVIYIDEMLLISWPVIFAAHCRRKLMVSVRYSRQEMSSATWAARLERACIADYTHNRRVGEVADKARQYSRV